MAAHLALLALLATSAGATAPAEPLPPWLSAAPSPIDAALRTDWRSTPRGPALERTVRAARWAVQDPHQEQVAMAMSLDRCSQALAEELTATDPNLDSFLAALGDDDWDASLAQFAHDLAEDPDASTPKSEADLWLPLAVFRALNPGEAAGARVVRAWLARAQRARRDDALRLAAAAGIQNLLAAGVPLPQLSPLVLAWNPPPPGKSQGLGRAMLWFDHGLVSRDVLGNQGMARVSFRSARKLYEALGQSATAAAATEAEAQLDLSGEAVRLFGLAAERFGTAGALADQARCLLQQGEAAWHEGNQSWVIAEKKDASRQTAYGAFDRAQRLLTGLGRSCDATAAGLSRARVLLLSSQPGERAEGENLIATAMALGQKNTECPIAAALLEQAHSYTGTKSNAAKSQFLVAAAHMQTIAGVGFAASAPRTLLEAAQLNEGEAALAILAIARDLFEAQGDASGVGRTWMLEADIRAEDLADDAEAKEAAAVAKATAAFEKAGDATGLASARTRLAHLQRTGPIPPVVDPTVFEFAPLAESVPEISVEFRERVDRALRTRSAHAGEDAPASVASQDFAEWLKISAELGEKGDALLSQAVQALQVLRPGHALEYLAKAQTLLPLAARIDDALAAARRDLTQKLKELSNPDLALPLPGRSQRLSWQFRIDELRAEAQEMLGKPRETAMALRAYEDHWIEADVGQLAGIHWGLFHLDSWSQASGATSFLTRFAALKLLQRLPDDPKGRAVAEQASSLVASAVFNDGWEPAERAASQLRAANLQELAVLAEIVAARARAVQGTDRPATALAGPRDALTQAAAWARKQKEPILELLASSAMLESARNSEDTTLEADWAARTGRVALQLAGQLPPWQRLHGLAAEANPEIRELMRAAAGGEQFLTAVAVVDALRLASFWIPRPTTSPAGPGGPGAERATVERRLAALERGEYASRLAASHASQEKVRSLLELHLETIDAWERSAWPATEAEDFSRLPDLIAAASRLGPILYLLGSANLEVLVAANPSLIEMRPLKIRGSAIELQLLLAHGVGDDRTRPAERSLFDEVLRPLVSTLEGYRELTVVPEGEIGTLPLAALRDEQGRRVFERWHLTTLPAVSLLDRLDRPTDSAASPIDFLVLTGGADGGPALSVDFQERLRQTVSPAGEFLARETSYETYSSFAPRAVDLLVSAPGIVKLLRDEQRFVPLESHLRIAPSEGHDSRLRALEIARIPLRAQLVVLLACDSVQAPAIRDPNFDLAKAFLTAGARSVLAPQWKVPIGPDTERFLGYFYKAYAKAGRKRADIALAEAQRLALQDRISSSVWGAWVLLGDRN